MYELYCCMSVQAALALRVGQALSSMEVTSFEGGFQHEKLELQPGEMEIIAGVCTMRARWRRTC